MKEACIPNNKSLLLKRHIELIKLSHNVQFYFLKLDIICYKQSEIYYIIPYNSKHLTNTNLIALIPKH